MTFPTSQLANQCDSTIFCSQTSSDSGFRWHYSKKWTEN